MSGESVGDGGHLRGGNEEDDLVAGGEGEGRVDDGRPLPEDGDGRAPRRQAELVEAVPGDPGIGGDPLTHEGELAPPELEENRQLAEGDLLGR